MTAYPFVEPVIPHRATKHVRSGYVASHEGQAEFESLWIGRTSSLGGPGEPRVIEFKRSAHARGDADILACFLRKSEVGAPRKSEVGRAGKSSWNLCHGASGILSVKGAKGRRDRSDLSGSNDGSDATFIVGHLSQAEFRPGLA